MIHLSELKKMEVVSADGHIIGTVKGIILTDKWAISGLSIKMKKEVIVEFGKKKPFLSSLYLDVSIDEIKAVKDKVVLQHLMEDVGACLLAHNSKFDADRLIGLEVLGSEGKVVGEVEDLKIEENFKLIPSLVIKVRKDALETMKMNKCLICGSLLNISMVHVVDVGDYVMLEATAENIGHILENITIQKE